MKADDLRQMRIDAGLKGTEMAKQIGVSASHLHAMETGKAEFKDKYQQRFLAVLENWYRFTDATQEARRRGADG